MSGCRYLTPKEVDRVINNFEGTFELRNKALFQLGVDTGYRISELLSLEFKDIFDGSRVKERIGVDRKNMKGKRVSRNNIKYSMLSKSRLGYWRKKALNIESIIGIEPSDPVFFSRKRNKDGNLKAISSTQAWRAFNKAVQAAGLDGKIGTHSMRKTAGVRCFLATGKDLKATQSFLGHSSVTDTMTYLSDYISDLDGITDKMHRDSYSGYK